MDENKNYGPEEPRPSSLAKENLKCKFCSKILSSRQNLKEHQYTHTGEKPYVCTEPRCGQSFRQGSLLSIHRKIHKELKKSPIVTQKAGNLGYLKLTDLISADRRSTERLALPIRSLEENSPSGESFAYILKFLDFK